MMRFSILALIVALAACTFRPGLWTWVHPDSSYAERHRERDIDACEQAALEDAMDGAFRPLVNARERGGWGNFSFEWCMQQRGWRLEFVPKKPGPKSEDTFP